MKQIITVNSIQKVYLRLSYMCFMLLIMDLLWLGTGAIWREKIGFSMRYIWFGGVIIFSLPTMLIRYMGIIFRESIFSYLWFFLLFCLYSFIIGIDKNNNFNVALHDLSGFANFIILPSLVCLLNQDKYISGMMKVVLVHCVALSIISCILSFWQTLPFNDQIYDFLNKYEIVALTPLNGGITRVFFHTGTRYLFIGILFASFFYFNARCKFIKNILLIIISIIWLAVLLSFTRGIYFACLVGLIIVILSVIFRCPNIWRKMYILLLKGAIMFSIVLLIYSWAIDKNPIIYATARSMQIIASSDIASNRMLSNSDIESINIRAIKKEMLMNSIAQSPIIGNGLGATIPYLNGLSEYFYYDITNKMGFIGLALFCLPLVSMYRKRYDVIQNTKQYYIYLIFFSGAIYFFIISATNPCLNTTTGILYYVIAIAVIVCVKRENRIAQF